MPAQYTKEELWKIFETLPPELKQTVFSQETADTIWETSERNGLGGEQMHQVAGIVGDSLMGLLHPEDLAQTIIDETGLSFEQASNVARDVNRLIMFPVKNYLYDFYKEITFVPSGKIVQSQMARPQQNAAALKQTIPAIVKPAPQRPFAKQKADDAYRETTE
ncbi:MAG: hypothetical protein PHW31_03670 [Candidatus Pacebacteria bacterium]|nr:hypothetical protein [Candidatus Paceibacterota bacterium]